MARVGRGPGDETLVHRVREGDATAFDALVRRHYRAAFAVARARVESPMDAEDVVQAAFVRALERLDECRPENFRAWFLTIVRNRAHNARVYEARRRGPDPEELAGSAVQTAEAGTKLVELGELRRALDTALDTLTEVQREVLLLHDLEGLGHAEIADTVGVTVGMSRYHLMQARRAMRAALDPGVQEAYGRE